MAVQTYTKAGAKSSTPAKLEKTIFGLNVSNHQLLKDSYVTYLSNGRASTAKTKHRGEVSGGGIKPWRQKGTGRARFGSSRNPIWRGGGSAFGPTGTQNPSRKLNQKSRQLALKQSLSLAAGQEKLKIIESLTSPNGRVRDVKTVLDKIEAKGQTVVVTKISDEKMSRSTKNLANLKIITAANLNAHDVLDADTLVITKEALDSLETRFLQPKETKR